MSGFAPPRLSLLTCTVGTAAPIASRIWAQGNQLVLVCLDAADFSAESPCSGKSLPPTPVGQGLQTPNMRPWFLVPLLISTVFAPSVPFSPSLSLKLLPVTRSFSLLFLFLSLFPSASSQPPACPRPLFLLPLALVCFQEPLWGPSLCAVPERPPLTMGWGVRQDTRAPVRATPRS